MIPRQIETNPSLAVSGAVAQPLIAGGVARAWNRVPDVGQDLFEKTLKLRLL